jgi:hypothetical protein
MALIPIRTLSNITCHQLWCNSKAAQAQTKTIKMCSRDWENFEKKVPGPVKACPGSKLNQKLKVLLYANEKSGIFPVPF